MEKNITKNVNIGRIYYYEESKRQSTEVSSEKYIKATIIGRKSDFLELSKAVYCLENEWTIIDEEAASRLWGNR